MVAIDQKHEENNNTRHKVNTLMYQSKILPNTGEKQAYKAVVINAEFTPHAHRGRCEKTRPIPETPSYGGAEAAPPSPLCVVDA